MRNIYPWIIVAAIIVGYLTFIHQLNNKENVTKRQPKSLFRYDEEQLKTTITLYPTLTSNNVYTSTTNFSSFEINYPDNWSIDSNMTGASSTITFRPIDSTNKSCIMIFQTKDNMPLLEAVNYSPFMMEKTGQPFFQKEAVETTISGQPAYMSKLRLSVNKPDQFVQNIVIVQRNTFTTVIRSCVGTKEELFYSILKGFKFL